MAAFVLCLALAVLAVGGSAAPESRIFGGNPTTIDQYPYLIALTYTYAVPGITIQRCVGGLLSSWHVLTTAYCFTGAMDENFGIRAGSTNSLAGGFVTYINQVVKHPSYVEVPRTGDLAIVFVSNLIFMTDVIRNVLIPYQNFYIEDNYPTTVVSWGFDSDGFQLELLKTVTLNKIPFAECVERYQDDENVLIDPTVICGEAPNVGMCFGDSGAPMVIDGIVVGVHSFYDECGSDKADIFTRVDQYSDWIMAVTTPSGV